MWNVERTIQGTLTSIAMDLVYLSKFITKLDLYIEYAIIYLLLLPLYIETSSDSSIVNYL